MEKKNTETRRILETVIPILLLVLIIGVGHTAFKLDENTRGIRLETEQNEKLIAENEAELNKQTEKRNELADQLEQIENYNETLAHYHDRFFELAGELENKILNDESELKIAYLTFDDGPYKMSNKFYDVLDEYDVQATFFCLKKCAEFGYDYDEIYDAAYRRILASGHTLGNHTASHKLGKNGIYSSVERFMDEIKENREFIEDRYGYTTEVMRFPGGTGTAGNKYYSIIEELRGIHYAWVDWNSATGDGGARILSANEYRDNVLNNTNGKKLLVVLMHDYSDNTLIALPEIIEGLSDQGYVFLPLFYESQAVNR